MQKIGLIDIYPVGAITKGLNGEELAEIGEMRFAGAIAFSDDGKPVMNSEVMRRAAEYIKGLDGIILSHPEDRDLADKGVINDGKVATITGLKGSQPKLKRLSLQGIFYFQSLLELTFIFAI